MRPMRPTLGYLAVCLTFGIALAEAPPLVNFQGKLTDSSGVPVSDAGYSIRFRIYSTPCDTPPCPDAADPCAGSCLWEETQTVATRSGLYSVLLGSVTALAANVFGGAERYVGIKVDAEVEMTPRRRIASVPYAISATTAQQTASSVSLGELSFRSTGVVYQASTDGLVFAFFQVGSSGPADGCGLLGYTGASDPPTNLVAKDTDRCFSFYWGNISFPVRAGEFYRLDIQGTLTSSVIHFVPLSS